MKITATPVKHSELRAGDLFSFVGQKYWDKVADSRSRLEVLYVRTDEPFQEFKEDATECYRITIERESISPQRETVNARGGFRFNKY